MVDSEISKVQKEIVEIKYPTWHPFFNYLGPEELKNFISRVDMKLEACNQRKEMSECKKRNEDHFNSKQCQIQPECVAPNPSQLFFMQDIFQYQLLLAPMMSINGNLVPSFQHNFNKGSSSQSQKLNFDANLMQLEAENGVVVDQISEIVVPLEHACQIDVFKDPSNKGDVPCDLLDESFNIFNQL